MLVLVSTSVLCPSSTGLGPVWVVVITSDRSTQAQTPPPPPTQVDPGLFSLSAQTTRNNKRESPELLLLRSREQFFKGSETSSPLNISAPLTSRDPTEAPVPSNNNLQLVSVPALKSWFCIRVLHMRVRPSFRSPRTVFLETNNGPN